MLEKESNLKLLSIEELLFVESLGLKYKIKESNNEYSSFTEYIFQYLLNLDKDLLKKLEKIQSKNMFLELLNEHKEDISIDNLIFKPVRSFNKKEFYKYLPKGDLIKWIITK